MNLRWPVRHPFLATALCVIVPNILGSLANFLYNLLNVVPELTPDQVDRFDRAVLVYNVAVYPVLTALFLAYFWPAARRIASGGDDRTRRRVVNLPFVAAGFVALGWVPTAAIFPAAVGGYWVHFALSTFLSSFIAVTQSFFALDLLVARHFVPAVFGDSRVSDLPGLRRIPLSVRFVFVFLSTALFPIAALVIIPRVSADPTLPLYVGGISALFGLGLAILLARGLLQPISELGVAMAAIRDGRLDAPVAVKRADELGALAEGFNDMLHGLRERERIRDSFGRSVGRHVATEILRRPHALGGELREVTILFLDIRDFTPTAAKLGPTQVVDLLNRVFGPMIQSVWAEQGEILTFLGDGFVAVFGAPLELPDHPARAVRAARAVLAACPPDVRVGIGLHTGTVVAGSVGAPERKQYTVIGDAVNLASRIEAHTKEAGRPLLLSAAVAARLGPDLPLEKLPSARLKGIDQPVELYALA